MKLIHVAMPFRDGGRSASTTDRYVLQEMGGAGLAWLPLDLLIPKKARIADRLVDRRT